MLIANKKTMMHLFVATLIGIISHHQRGVQANNIVHLGVRLLCARFFERLLQIAEQLGQHLGESS